MQEIVERFQKLLSCCAGALVAIFYFFNIITNIFAVLPHIITFSTTALVIEGLVFSILLSLKDSKFLKLIQGERPSSVRKQFRALKKMVFYSLCVILLCIAILSFNFNICNFIPLWLSTIVKSAIAWFGAYLFFMMITSTFILFNYSVDLLWGDSTESGRQRNQK